MTGTTSYIEMLQSTADAVKIIQDRVKEGLEEIRASIGRNKPARDG